MAIPRKELFEIWLTSSKETRRDAVLEKIFAVIGRDVDTKKLGERIKKLCYQFSSKWEGSCRVKARVLARNYSWFSKSEDFGKYRLDVGPSTSSSIRSNVGRPHVAFSDSSLRTKKRKAKSLLAVSNSEQVLMAAEMGLRSNGKRNSAILFKELCLSSPSRGTVLKKSRLSKERNKSLSPDQALALIIDANDSTHDYNMHRQHTAEINPKLYPSYNCIKKSKALCYPEKITVTETYAEIELQALIDHSIKRLCIAQKEVLLSIPSIQEVFVTFKWGCDGSEQKRYKQKFSEENQSDSSMFFVSLVLLQMYTLVNERRVVIWRNPVPSSTRYCRPIKFLFEKETRDAIVREVKIVEDQISNLLPTIIKMENLNFKVTSTLILCMIDGKVCNALSAYTSSQACYICGASAKDMNNFSALSERKVDANMLRFGISPLHSWIRCMECMLHIAYRLELRTWCVRGAENKEKLKQRKESIQSRFRNETGLLIDMPKEKSGKLRNLNNLYLNWHWKMLLK